MDATGYVWKRLVYSLLCAAADTSESVLSVLASYSQPRTSLLPSDIDQLSDEAILELAENAPKLCVDGRIGVLKLTPCTVAKSSQDRSNNNTDASEANVLNLVFTQTSIPVPRVRRVVKCEWDHLIIMDYVEGQTLAEAWSDLSMWKKIWVAFTLRRYVKQLRRVKASASTPPGPPGEQGPRKCHSPIFGEMKPVRGPFASYAELSTFFNERCKMGLDANRVPADDPSRKELFDDSSPLILTHQDLNPRNIILGVDGRLWVIDWAWSGYYPPWFEYVAMVIQTEHEELVGFKDRFWELAIPFICDPYFKQESWLCKMSRAFAFR